MTTFAVDIRIWLIKVSCCNAVKEFPNLSFMYCFIIAVAPATCGLAIEVPLILAYPPLTEEYIPSPGAAISGFNFKSGVTPQDEKSDA